MEKRKEKLIIFFILVLIVTVAIIIFLGYFFQPKEEEKIKKGGAIQEDITFPSEKAERFSITSSNSYPTFFKELIVDPAISLSLYKIKEGEKQTYSIWVKDPNRIKEVMAEVKTDKGIKIIRMKLVEGSLEEGRWQGSWIVRNVSSMSSYTTTLKAVSFNGRETKVTVPWYTK